MVLKILRVRSRQSAFETKQRKRKKEKEKVLSFASLHESLREDRVSLLLLGMFETVSDGVAGEPKDAEGHPAERSNESEDVGDSSAHIE